MSTIAGSRRRPTVLMMAVAAVGALAAPLGVRTAAACSPPLIRGYGSFVGNTPVDGATEVPVNGPVILDVEYRVGAPKETTVSVFEADTGAAVAGGFNVYAWGRPFVAWLPTEPLRPQTRYRVEAAIVSEIARPADATGAPEVSFAFTTGDGPLPPIELQGEMQVQIETYTREREDWSRCLQTSACTSCGCDRNLCAPTIVREVVSRARVTLPAVVGGLSDLGYAALVRVTADSPYQFPDGPDLSATGVRATGSTFGLGANTPSELLFDLDQGQPAPPFRPCFALRVTDLAGNVRDGAPVCLAQIVTPVQNPDHEGGCRVAGREDGEPGWAWLGLAALLSLGARRRAARTRQPAA